MEDYEEINEVVEENQNNEFLFGKQQPNFNEITDSFKFKSELLKLDDKINGLMNKDIILANFSEKDNRDVKELLSMARTCLHRGYLMTAEDYYNDVLSIAGISRGTKGFQQEKFNEQRDIRESRVQTPVRNKWWRR
jgi:hypothetical protein